MPAMAPAERPSPPPELELEFDEPALGGVVDEGADVAVEVDVIEELTPAVVLGAHSEPLSISWPADSASLVILDKMFSLVSAYP